MKKRFFLLWALGMFVWSPAVLNAATESVVTLKILARVANRSLSNRDLYIYSAILNPRAYVPSERNFLREDESKQLLQELLVQILVEEENKIIGTATVSDRTIDAELKKLEKNFGRTRWKQFREDFELADSEIRSLVRRSLLVENTLSVRLRDSMNDLSLKGQPQDKKIKAAETSLQNWLQQLRSRYKVQIFSEIDAPVTFSSGSVSR
ncbi:hypothetical protein GW916_04315 [bacterium]|nr:hypothetical protein [bacterium]